MKAEIGVMCLQAKKHQRLEARPQVLREKHEQIVPYSPEKEPAMRTIDLRLLASRTLRPYISSFLLSSLSKLIYNMICLVHGKFSTMINFSCNTVLSQSQLPNHSALSNIGHLVSGHCSRSREQDNQVHNAVCDAQLPPRYGYEAGPFWNY